MRKKITIKDIAKVADVSIGTVDRVLHKRGKVSEEALQKVNEALKSLDYKPNPMARSLKNNVVHKIAILIPNPEKDPYWLPCKLGILEIIAEYEAFDLDIIVDYFDPFIPNSFQSIGESLISKAPNAFLFVPLFERESDLLLKKLETLDIPTSTFNSLPRNHVHQHVGQDLYLSGRVSAKLMFDFLPTPSKIGIIHIDESFNNAIHIQQKEQGFRSFFEAIEGYELLTQTIHSGTGDYILSKFIEEQEVSAFFVTTSKTHEVAKVLDTLNKNGLVVGYDLVPENIKYLQENKIQFLIHQAPKTQASLSLKSLIEKLLFDKSFPDKQFLPIEIINSENVKSYL